MYVVGMNFKQLLSGSGLGDGDTTAGPRPHLSIEIGIMFLCTSKGCGTQTPNELGERRILAHSTGTGVALLV